VAKFFKNPIVIAAICGLLLLPLMTLTGLTTTTAT